MPDLSTINDSTKWGNFDRDVRFDSVVIFAAKASEGPIWLKNYSFQNGLQRSTFYRGAGIKTSKGELFFGGLDGFNYFNPALLHNNKK